MLSIRTDIMSNFIMQNMESCTDKLNKSMQRLSTGYKINSASDDAANWAISKKIDSQISGLKIANDNIKMGIDALNSASSNYDLITNDLQKLMDLATEASNGTYSDDDCKTINIEAQSLIEQINKEIAKNNSDVPPGSKIQTGTTSNDTYEFPSLAIDIDLSKVNLSDNTAANSSIDIIDGAIKTLINQNTKVGASINVLESRIQLNTVNTTSLEATNSTIRDVDVAEEVANIVRQQILLQVNAFLFNENLKNKRSIILSLIQGTSEN